MVFAFLYAFGVSQNDQMKKAVSSENPSFLMKILNYQLKIHVFRVASRKTWIINLKSLFFIVDRQLARFR